MGKQSAVFDAFEDQILNGPFSKRRGFVQIADDLTAEDPEIIDVPADGLP